MNARVLVIAWKELLQLRRDRLTLGMMVVLPLMQLMLFGYAINTDVRNMPTVVYDQDASRASRDLARRLEATTEALAALLSEGGEALDRFRVVVFPVITGATGKDRIFDGYPDVALELVESRTFDGRLQLLEYVPTVLAGPPGTTKADA